jgi:hypothetical protein
VIPFDQALQQKKSAAEGKPTLPTMVMDRAKLVRWRQPTTPPKGGQNAFVEYMELKKEVCNKSTVTT